MFCHHPFDRMEIKADGNAYCCCENWLPKPMGNVLTDGLMGTWKGSSARNIRDSILDGSFRYCTSCPFLPGPGGCVTASPPTPPTSDSIRTLKLDYDQSCNLACPSCRTAHSKDFVKEDEIAKIHDVVLASQAINHARMLYLTGAGDPFASKLYRTFLQHLPEMTPNTNLQIFLHTNGLLFDEAHWAEMGPARELVSGVGISIDAACEETYRQNRQASWKKLWENIDFINSLRKKSSHPVALGMFFTMQANNFQEVPAFTRLAFHNHADGIDFNLLSNWGTYTSDEYTRRAVHQPTHPQHDRFLQMLRDPCLDDPRITIPRQDTMRRQDIPLIFRKLETEI